VVLAAALGDGLSEVAVHHLTCDVCGRPLFRDAEVRYEVRIEVKAAYDPLHVASADLERDYRKEIQDVLRRLEGLSSREARDQVYRTFDFDLCLACQRRYVQEPLPRPPLPSS
jgi:hypothetical protein